jgi:SAM-dependent methyltransferase
MTTPPGKPLLGDIWDGPDGLRRMREDWDRRAQENAEHFVYTRDSQADPENFEVSGQANYDQLVRPYLPILLRSRAPGSCRVAEIGCGIGRMTRCFADNFAEVHALDISPLMIEQARQRLAGRANVHFHVTAGDSLAPLPDATFDLVFSYIVFQHVPSKAAIESYVREAARVLAPGGAFKFQLNGSQFSSSAARKPDSWVGAAFSLEEASSLLSRSGFSLLAAEGIGTQYFVLTGIKGPPESEPHERSYILAGEDWAARQLIEGFADPVNQSWRPIASHSRARLRVPAIGQKFFFAGIYFWPETNWQSRRLRFTIGGEPSGDLVITQPGDHYTERPVSHLEPRTLAAVQIEIDPPCEKNPAFRAMGIFATRNKE